MSNLQISSVGFDLIKSFEGLRDGDPSTVHLDPYLCPADVATIGWGHAITHNGKQLRGRAGLHIARTLYPNGITLEEAENLLRADVREREIAVASLIKVKVTQGQFDALVSFAFNVGTDIDADTIPEGLGDSTLLRLLNEGNPQRAALEFHKWNKAGGRVLLGLTRRRAAEAKLFVS